MKLLYAGLAIMTSGAVGVLLAVIFEINTGEPIYLIMMKIAAGLFGVGGPLVGIAVARRRRR